MILQDMTTATASINLSTVMQTVMIAAIIGAWRSVAGFQRQAERWQQRVDHVLFGIDGTNGLHGTVKEHGKRIRALEQSDDDDDDE